jgi:two-component system, OmpR family, response regulator CpxR
MAIITIFSTLYCNEYEVTAKLAKKLDYSILDENLIEETSNNFNLSANKLRSTLSGNVPFLNNITHEREKNLAYIKSSFANLVKKNNIIYNGFATHLLPKNISHILRVCLIANHGYKIKMAMEKDGLSEQNAKNTIRKDDEKRFKWVHDICNLTPWDESLYDIIIPMHSSSIDGAVDLISENVRKSALETTPESQKAIDDFVFVSKVNIPLVENGYDVNIDNDNGNITISLKEYVIRFAHIKEKIMKITSAVEGVKNVEVIMGPNARVPSRYDELEAPPRFLLVDDEKEFVQTLSDRLQTRDLNSAIAYDGDEALSYIEKDEPDVMVLDLKMPGINGMDVLRKVKKERPHVEVIILTGHGSETDKTLAMELGAFAYLEKPVDIDVLTKTMKDAYNKINKGKGKK